eukprot:scaffold379177_cov49-Attheya_sp.AAC.2
MTTPQKRKRCKPQSRHQTPSSPSQRRNNALVGEMLDHSLLPTLRKRPLLHNKTTHSETVATNAANLSSQKKESKNGNHPQSNSNHKKTKKSSGGKKANDKTKKMIRKEDINLLPLVSWDGPVRLLNSGLEMEEAVQEIMSSGETLLGFDTETRPTFQKGEPRHPPALVQIATSTCVYLFRISQTRSLDPLVPLLEAAHMMKTGVAIHNDVKELKSMYRGLLFHPQGFVEIASLTRDVLGYENIGLRALAAIFMKKRVSKGAQTSNWASPQLSAQQTRYAATDAWVSREIYLRAKTEHEELIMRKERNETTTNITATATATATANKPS